MGLSNREAFLKAKKYLSTFKDLEFFDSEIYLLLIKANNYKNFTELIKNFDEKLANIDYFDRNLKKLSIGEPIQYIVKEAPFFNLDITVNKDVLIPRPETEGLVQIIIDEIKKNNIPHQSIGDICTGSGCIALYFKTIFPTSNVYAIDKYSNALNIAKINFKKYGKEIITFLGDKIDPLLSLNIQLDILVSNPPYVSNLKELEEKVIKYEPLHAIYSKNGTEFYEYYFKNYKKIMNRKFLMGFEINYDQEEKLTFYISKYFDLKTVSYRFIKDIYGKTRYLIIEGENNESIN